MVQLSKASLFDYIRFLFSSSLLLFSMTVTVYAIVERKTLFWHVVPGWAALLLFVVVLVLLALAEGLQIALVELKRQHPDVYRLSHPRAHTLGEKAAHGDNVERFLVGRQVAVVLLVFLSAKLTTVPVAASETFPGPRWLRAMLLESGLLAAVVVVVVAQLTPQILAAQFPVHFLQMIVMKPAYYACVAIECTGIAHASWLLTALLGRITGITADTVDISEGTIAAVATALEEDASANNIAVSCNNVCYDGEDVLEKIDTVCIDETKEFSRYSELVARVNAAVSEDALHIVRRHLDTHPEVYHHFPAVIGSRVYPSPQSLAVRLHEDGHDVPKFLTDVSDPGHVPPHIVACELLARNRQLQQEIRFLNAKLNA